MKAREVFYNRSNEPIVITALSQLDEFGCPSQRRQDFMVMPDQGIDLSITGLVREVLPQSEMVDEDYESARETALSDFVDMSVRGILTNRDLAEHMFKAGAEWQKAKDAILINELKRENAFFSCQGQRASRTGYYNAP